MVLYNTTLRALLLNSIYFYKGKINKMHENFLDLKHQICEWKNVRKEISEIEYIRLLGTIYAERNDSHTFHDIIRKHDLIHQVYATKIYSWQYANKFKCMTAGIEKPTEYNWALGKDGKYYPYEKL